MKVGHQSLRYPVTQNIFERVPEVKYVKVHNFATLRRNLAGFAPWGIRSATLLNHADLGQIFNDFGLNRVDLIHFFNRISLGKTPWITTFEGVVPRFLPMMRGLFLDEYNFGALARDDTVRRALDALASNSCRGLIAISEASARLQRELLEHFPAQGPQIAPKVTVLHPPQDVLVESFAEKRLALDGELHFMFVGSAFFRKGGAEILAAFQEARLRHGPTFRLSIISSFKPAPYAVRPEEKDVKAARAARAIITANSDWIDHYEHLPNAEVLNLMNSAHVGLLPTRADTFGFSVLEFQSCGCPVISTNVRALPEINNSEIGWLIEVPKHDLGEARYATADDMSALSLAIEQGLGRAIDEIMARREDIPLKADGALQRIRSDHSPLKFSKRMLELYTAALHRSSA